LADAVVDGAGNLAPNGLDSTESEFEDTSGESTNFTRLTPQIYDAVMKGVIPADSLEPEDVNTILGGGFLPGFTSRQTFVLKRYFIDRRLDLDRVSKPIVVPTTGNALVPKIAYSTEAKNNVYGFTISWPLAVVIGLIGSVVLLAVGFIVGRFAHTPSRKRNILKKTFKALVQQENDAPAGETIIYSVN